MSVNVPKRQLTVLLVAWAAAGAIVVALVLAGRTLALERGQRSAEVFAMLLEEHTDRTFDAIQLTLRAVVDAYQLNRPPKNDPNFQQLLTLRLKDIPDARGIFIIGPDGWVTHGTNYPSTPNLLLDDQPYFKLHQRNVNLGGSVSPPVLRRSGRGWFLAVSQKLGRGATFEGVAVAAVPIEDFEQQFQKMGLGDTDVIALFHRSGALVARYPKGDGDATGKDYDHLPMFAYLPANPVGTFRTSEGMHEGAGVVAYRALESYPLVVSVSRPYEAMLAEWRRTAIGAAVGMFALTLLLGMVVFYVIRQHRREESSRHQREQADKLEAIGQLTGGIAHDFRNLLNVVALNLEMMQKDTERSPQSEQALQMAKRALARGTEQIQRLLAFAKQQSLTVEPTDLNGTIASARELLAQAAGPRVAIVEQLAPALPKVPCDAGPLEVALLNLVVNARDAMSDSGRIVLRTRLCDDDKCRIVTRGHPLAKHVCLVVEDSGCGMSDAIRRRVLEPFFTTKGDAGTGLGLSQVYGFMRQIGGDVRIESALGAGTSVHLLFPLHS